MKYEAKSPTDSNILFFWASNWEGGSLPVLGAYLSGNILSTIPWLNPTNVVLSRPSVPPPFWADIATIDDCSGYIWDCRLTFFAIVLSPCMLISVAFLNVPIGSSVEKLISITISINIC